MRVPLPGEFRQQAGPEVGPPCWAAVPGADFDLYVSDRDGDPDPDSLAFAERVLPRVYELRAAAARYLGEALVVRSIPRLDPEIAQIVSLFCDGGSRTVVLDLNWEADLYNLWYVRFRGAPAGLRPVELGHRFWGGPGARWRPPFRPIGG